MAAVTDLNARAMILVAAGDGGMTSKTWKRSVKKADALEAVLGPPDAETILSAEGIDDMRDVMATVTGIVRTETP